MNGETWTFHTPPPPPTGRTVRSSHPRLFLTPDNLPTLRTKLQDPAYASNRVELGQLADSDDPLANAFLYHLNGDTTRGQRAKALLLADSFGDIPGIDKAGEYVEPILVFDWVMPLLSSQEKSQAFAIVLARQGYDHRAAQEGSRVEWYWNDTWARHPQLHYPILALAIAGDGIDDAWATEVLGLAYSESTRALGPYGAAEGSGFLDMLATLSLDDGGGAQAGSYGGLGINYYSMFLHAFMPLGAWETATGQPMWARCNFFRKLPVYWAYDKKNLPGDFGVTMLEFITGIYKDIEPEAAGLARWMLNKWGRGRYNLVYRLILGDLRVSPRSPAQVGLPTAAYIRGSDLFVSSRSWAEDSLTLTAYFRYLDTSRFEPGSGVFAVHRGQEPLAVPGELLKQPMSAGTYSGFWIYDPSDVGATIFEGSTYWSGDRAYEAYSPVSQPVYFRGGPDRMEVNGPYRGVSMAYADSLNAPGVRTVRRTLVHIVDAGKDFIVVYDYSDVPPSLKRAWSMRLAVTPSIVGNRFSIPGMHTTVAAPANPTLAWVGGSGDELRSPPPEKVWYGNDKNGNTPGYSSDPVKAKQNGIGNLFVQPVNPPEQLEFLVVLEVTDAAPVDVTRVADNRVRFGGWDVSFDRDGGFQVVRQGADTTAPASPGGLRLTQVP
ncbi:MAG: hypothetical protein JXR37_08340 [Kiritimatiellae bacterium]|nr:hypothetical protein [Kiritimatiellia bacterium]